MSNRIFTILVYVTLNLYVASSYLALCIFVSIPFMTSVPYDEAQVNTSTTDAVALAWIPTACVRLTRSA